MEEYKKRPHILTELLGEVEGVRDFSDFAELLAVLDAETLEAVIVAPLVKVLLKCTTTPVRHVTADLALVLDAQSVQFVEPEGDRIAQVVRRVVLLRELHLLLLVILNVTLVIAQHLRFLLLRSTGHLTKRQNGSDKLDDPEKYSSNESTARRFA